MADETPNYAPPIPAAVRAAAEKADAIQQDYIKQMNGEEPPEQGEEEQEEQQEEQQEGQEEQPSEEQEQYEQDQQFQQQPDQPSEEQITDAGWRHRYESMRGRYNSEVPKLRGQVNQLMNQVNNLNRLLSTVSRPAPAPSERTFKSQVKPEEIAEYGPDFVDLVSRIVKDTTVAHEAEIADLKNQVKHVGSQVGASARERMMQQLTERVPDWEQINTHPDFLDWLVLPDAYSGDIRHNMLNAAFERNDAPRVIAFFEGFLAEMAAVAPPDKEPSRKAVRLNKTPLRNLAAPGRARSAAPPPPRAPAEKPIITASQIAKFYTEKGLGKWKGREKEAADIEAEIFAAQSEGRIR